RHSRRGRKPPVPCSISPSWRVRGRPGVAKPGGREQELGTSATAATSHPFRGASRPQRAVVPDRMSVGSDAVKAFARPSGARRRAGILRQRLLVQVLSLASWLACRLPERPLVALAELLGDAWYRADRDRAAQGRRNLRRVVERLAEIDLGSEVARRAAGDPAVLERLVRAAFRHQARYYLEVARTPAMTGEFVRRRLIV